jgi:hypothetical protein
MPTRRRVRAQKRIAARTRANAKAKEAALTLEEEPQPRRMVRHQTHLERLEARGVITATQKRAGERLYWDWRTGAEGHPHLVASYEPRLGGKGYGCPPLRSRTPSTKSMRGCGSSRPSRR